MNIARSQRDRIAETERLALKPQSPMIKESAPPTPPQRSPLRNSVRASPVGLRPPTPEAEDRSSTIWILYDEYNANGSATPSLASTDDKSDTPETPADQAEDSQIDPDSRRTSVTTVSLSNFKRFLEQPEDSPYDTNELNERLQKQLEKMAARRSWHLDDLEPRVPVATYSKVDQSEADRIRSMPTVDERPSSPKKPVTRDDGKDISSESVSSPTITPSTPARRIVIPTPQPELVARSAPAASEPAQKPKNNNLEVSVPLREESMVASLQELFAAPPGQPQPSKTDSIIPPRSFIPNGARLPIQPSAPPTATPVANTKAFPSSISPQQQSYLRNSPPELPTMLTGSPPIFYNMQPAAKSQYHISPPLPSLPAPQSQSYTPPMNQSFLRVEQPSLVVTPGSPPRVGPSPTQPRLAQLQVGQRLSPEEYRQVISSSNVLSSPETLVATSSDNDSSTPYGMTMRKEHVALPPINVLDAKWPSRDPTVLKMQRRHAGIVGPSNYTPPDFLSQIQEEDITEQKPLARKPAVGTGPRPASSGSDKEVKIDETRGRSRVRGEDGNARVRSSNRESLPPKLGRGLTVNSGMTDFTSVKTGKGTGHVRLGDERKLKRQELVRKRRRDVFALKAAVLISVLNLMLVDALLVFWLVKGGASSLFGKA